MFLILNLFCSGLGSPNAHFNGMALNLYQSQVWLNRTTIYYFCENLESPLYNWQLKDCSTGA